MKLTIFLLVSLSSQLLFSGRFHLFPPRPIDEWKESFIITMRHGTRLDGVWGSEELTFEDWKAHAAANNFEHWDSPLAPPEHQGYLEDSIHQIISEGLFPEIIISSPYRRAAETARIIRDRLSEVGHRVEILGDPRIQEWPHASFGRHGYPIPENFRWRTSSFRLEDELTHESEGSYVFRVASVLRNHAQKYKRVLVVGHQHTIAAMFPYGGGFARLEAGGYAFGIFEKGTIVPDISRSRGLIFHTH